MKIDANSLSPIYIQIADAIEDDILSGTLPEGGNCYSQVVISKELTVNPATAAKGINLLVGRGILEKQRGQAMTVAADSKKKIMDRRRDEVFGKLAEELVIAAKKLDLSQDYVLKTITKFYEEGK
ncbi:MAG: GntR family transcriptional regulator [Clostridium sp.]|uniref:GntR family transcriptional regulator n=1 Tax=Clostridium sp. TaxID=1506 RepID=UPI0030330E08